MKTSTDCPMAINPRRSIGGYFSQIVIEEEHEDQLEITDFPVESGASISDHAFKLPEHVTIVAATSATQEDITAAYNKLLELQNKREPFDIITGKRKYTSMLLKSLVVQTDKERENALWFRAACKRIRIVGTRSTSLPPVENHALPNATAPTSSTGDKQAVPASVNESALSKLMG